MKILVMKLSAFLSLKHTIIVYIMGYFLDSDDIGPSVVVHTSVPFSLKHLETDKEDMKDVIMSHLKQVLPDLPQPTEIKSHKWRFSQVLHVL